MVHRRHPGHPLQKTSQKSHLRPPQIRRHPLPDHYTAPARRQYRMDRDQKGPPVPVPLPMLRALQAQLVSLPEICTLMSVLRRHSKNPNMNSRLSESPDRLLSTAGCLLSQDSSL